MNSSDLTGNGQFIFFGNTIQNEYLMFFLILIGSFIFAEVFSFVLKTYAKRLTSKTRTDIDDIVLGMITRPLIVSITLAGFYFALKTLTVISPYAFVIDNLFFIAFMLIASFVASRILGFLLSRWLKVQKRFEKTPQLLVKIVTVVIYSLAFLIILDHFNIEITPLIATLGIGGLAVGLALQNTLSNFFAGLHIISDRPVSVGDFIELQDGVSGYVEDIGWRSTRIKTLPNTIVIVPNSKLAESTITNYALPDPQTAALVDCGVAYTSDLDRVEQVTVEVARHIQKTVPGAVKDFVPFIRYNKFGDSNINFTVILRVEKVVDKYLVIHEFMKALKRRYDEEGIEISWPVRKIYYAK